VTSKSLTTRDGALVPLGAFIAGTRAGSMPEAARRAARYQLLDMVAAAHASARSPECARFFANMPFGAGAATVVASGARLAPIDAAFVNTAYSMAEDYDDIVWMGHTGHSAVFASLAVAEAEERDAVALITAIVVANEIAGRIGASSFLGPLNGQMWTFIHVAGAAAATASLLGLTATQCAHALAIALAQPPYALQPAFFGPTSKVLAAAIPTQIGIQAAYLARNGMRGALDILEDPKGFWGTFSFRALPEMLGGLGELWVTETLSIKSAPACHYFQTACEAISEIKARRVIGLENVQRVVVSTTKLGEEVTRFAREYAGARRPDLSSIGASFDLGLTAAICLHAGRFTGDESRAEWLDTHAAALTEWYRKIQVRHDPALTMRVLDGASAIPAGREALSKLGLKGWVQVFRRGREHYGSTLLRPREALGWARVALARIAAPPHTAGAAPSGEGIALYFPNHVLIELQDGSRETARVDLPAGSIARAGMADELSAKFLREVGPRLGAERAQRALECGLDIEARGLGAFVELAARPRRTDRN
jgi:2-methylcitrate dehydratase PrpD